jgi:hypothetical protein
MTHIQLERAAAWLALVGGLLLVGLGVRSCAAEKHMAETGVRSTARVVDAWESARSRGRVRPIYGVTAEYRAPGPRGDTMVLTATFDDVAESHYKRALETGEVEIKYLPDDPSVVRSMGDIEGWPISFLAGAVLAIAGLIGLQHLRADRYMRSLSFARLARKR